MLRALALAALLLLSLAPSASASGAGLSLEGPEGAAQASQVPLKVRVVVDDAVCGGDADLRVRLAAYGPSGAQVAVPEEVLVHVPAGGYMARPFEGDADATLTISAPPGSQGQVMVAAGYDLPSSCVTTGDSSAKAQLEVSYAMPGSGDAPPAPVVASPSPAAPGPGPEPAPVAAEPSSSSSGAGLLALLLGIGLVATVFFVVGRLGQRSQAGGRDDLP